MSAPGVLVTLLTLLMLVMGCETDDFFITGDTDDCPSSTGDADADADADAEATPTTSFVMEAPLTEMTPIPGQAGRATPLEPTLPGPTPAQER